MVERLYHAAAPKLLKTLEEPENKTLFILIAENSDKILATILSRTQLIKIPPVSEENVKKQLMAEYNSPEEVAEDIAAISEGNYI
jgi:DNA polymerase-3 subunit delta'